MNACSRPEKPLKGVPHRERLKRDLSARARTKTPFPQPFHSPLLAAKWQGAFFLLIIPAVAMPPCRHPYSKFAALRIDKAVPFESVMVSGASVFFAE
jgi:hypothetical protein